MTTSLAHLAEAYVRSINAHDAAAFLALFAESAMVDDAGREFRGRAAIQSWGQREIFSVNVTLEPLRSSETAEEVAVLTKVDGDFDRSGLPDPVVIEMRIQSDGSKITNLRCRLASEPT